MRFPCLLLCLRFLFFNHRQFNVDFSVLISASVPFLLLVLATLAFLFSPRLQWPHVYFQSLTLRANLRKFGAVWAIFISILVDRSLKKVLWESHVELLACSFLDSDWLKLYRFLSHLSSNISYVLMLLNVTGINSDKIS